MDKIVKNQKKILMLSPLIQSSQDALGNGFVGFTVQYADWEIENFIFPYDEESRVKAINIAKKEHSRYTLLSSPDVIPKEAQSMSFHKTINIHK